MAVEIIKIETDNYRFYSQPAFPAEMAPGALMTQASEHLTPRTRIWMSMSKPIQLYSELK